MHRLQLLEVCEARCVCPAEEVGNRPGVGLPGVPVADVDGEELDEPAAGVLSGGCHWRRDWGLVAGKDEGVVHRLSVANSPRKCNNIKDVMLCNPIPEKTLCHFEHYLARAFDG